MVLLHTFKYLLFKMLCLSKIKIYKPLLIFTFGESLEIKNDGLEKNNA